MTPDEVKDTIKIFREVTWDHFVRHLAEFSVHAHPIDHWHKTSSYQFWVSNVHNVEYFATIHGHEYDELKEADKETMRDFFVNSFLNKLHDWHRP